MKMKTVFLSMAVAVALLTTSAKAASIGTCTEIVSVPLTITIQGVYCLQSDKSSSFQGNLITINANNVTIDMNGVDCD